MATKMSDSVEDDPRSTRSLSMKDTGKHMFPQVNNDVLEGGSDDKPTVMEESVSQEDKVTEGSGGMETPRRQPGAGEQDQGGSGARCSYTAGGVCSLHGPGAKLRWKPIVGEYVPGVRGEKKRHYFYVCMKKPGGTPRGRGLRQTTLAFVRVTEDTRNTGEMKTKRCTKTKEGQ